MNNQHAIRTLTNSLLLLIVLAVSGSCTERELDFRDEDYVPPVVEVKGYVAIRPDWNGCPSPKGTTFRFYRLFSGTPSIEKECPPEGFEGFLPVGTYQVMAYNSGITGVSFQDMQQYGTALAHATDLSLTRASGLFPVSQPGELYSCCIDTLVVTKETPVERVVIPRPLSRIINFSFKLTGDGAKAIKSITGEFYGVWSSVFISSGKTSTSMIEASHTYTPFAAGMTSEFDGAANIRIFGLFDPLNEENYDNKMNLSLTGASGERYYTQVDLNSVLSDIIEKNHGEIPINIPVEIDVELSLVDAVLLATVLPWVPGTGGGEIQ